MSQFVETFVFDLPAVVSEVEDRDALGQGARHGRGPPPVAVDGSFDPFFGDALAANAGLVGMDHAQLGVDGFGAEALGHLRTYKTIFQYESFLITFPSRNSQ